MLLCFSMNLQLGVLFLPSHVKEEDGGFSCTDNGVSSKVVTVSDSIAFIYLLAELSETIM